MIKQAVESISTEPLERVWKNVIVGIRRVERLDGGHTKNGNM